METEGPAGQVVSLGLRFLDRGEELSGEWVGDETALRGQRRKRESRSVDTIETKSIEEAAMRMPRRKMAKAGSLLSGCRTSAENLMRRYAVSHPNAGRQPQSWERHSVLSVVSAEPGFA